MYRKKKREIKMKPTINEIEIAKKIINGLIEHDFFDAIVCEDCENFGYWCDEHKNYIEKAHLELHCGETKGCIISDELPNWVIKVGFITEDTEDYCAIEADNFIDVVKKGLEEFFAAIYEICDIPLPESFSFKRYVTFFMQEKAEPDEEKTSSTCSEYTGTDDNSDYDRLESLFEGYKNDDFEKLIEFIDDWHINDLHSGNFGYTKDGKVKIIDYSGY